MTGRRLPATLVGICLLAALLGLGVVMSRGGIGDPAPGVVVVTGSPLRKAPSAASAPLPTDDAIERSERNAAVPSAGGPGPEDTRPRQIPGAVTAVRDATGARLDGTGAAYYANGFEDGDVLTSVDGRSVASMPDGVDVGGLLIPGAMIEVTRRERPIAWRIGGKAE